METCCGFGGTFSVKFESISIGMAEQKVNNALATGAEYIISHRPELFNAARWLYQGQALPLKNDTYCRCTGKRLGMISSSSLVSQFEITQY